MAVVMNPGQGPNINRVPLISSIKNCCGLKFSSFTFCIIIILLINGCKEASTDPVNEQIPNPIPNPVLIGNYALCYTKSLNDHWEIFTTNFNGSDPQNVSNHFYDDDYPQWSPDGRYIVYYSEYQIYVYDTQNKTENKIASSEDAPGQMPKWIPNGKVCIDYPYAWSKDKGTFLINPDGSQKKKILDTVGTAIYFYEDSYTFIYVDGKNKIHKTNIDSTFDEIVFDLCTLNNTPIQGFNPDSEEILVTTNSNAIETYSIRTKSNSILLAAQTGFDFSQIKYSNDFLKIALIEHSENNDYLSILENGIKRRLVHIPATNPKVSFSWIPVQFSPDDKYIAFSKQYWNNGEWVSWKDYLYVVDVNTGETTLVDEGHNPFWNPKP